MFCSYECVWLTVCASVWYNLCVVCAGMCGYIWGVKKPEVNYCFCILSVATLVFALSVSTQNKAPYTTVFEFVCKT